MSSSVTTAKTKTKFAKLTVLVQVWCRLVKLPEARAGSRQFNPSTAVHLSFKSLQSVDMPFGWTVAPKVFHRMFYRWPILLQLPYKRLNGANPGSFCFLRPAL